MTPMRESVLKEALVTAAKAAGIPAPEVALEYPADLSHGDFASNIALRYAAKSGDDPRSLAEKISEKLGSISGVSRVQIAGAGFINFYLDSAAVGEALQQALKKKEQWGAGEHKKGLRVMVEYTDPNPFKEFHIGHLMSNAIGESVSRIIEFTGADVKRANYQGDVGPHVAKALWHIQKTNPSNITLSDIAASYAEGNRAYESDAEAKREIDELNRRIYEKNDPHINLLYERGRELSLAHFEELYKKLGTNFDFYFFESETGPRGVEIVRGSPSIFEESEGAVVYRGEKAGLHTRVFITSNGLPTYEAKELGLADMKAQKWRFDVSITVTGNEQKEYFDVVLAAMKEVMPSIAEKITHIPHGMMRLPGGKMSSRTGNVITGESLLAELEEKARERATLSRAGDPNTLATEIAVAAVKYQILKQGLGKNIVFDRDAALSLEGDSGPYLQYTHARTCALRDNAREGGVDAELDSEKAPIDLSRLLVRFPSMVERAERMCEPHIVTNFLLECATAFNRWYAAERILDGTQSAAHKFAISEAARHTLRNGLQLLGIPAPEKM